MNIINEASLAENVVITNPRHSTYTYIVKFLVGFDGLNVMLYRTFLTMIFNAKCYRN